VEEFLNHSGATKSRATLWSLQRSALESASVLGAGTETEWQLVIRSRSLALRLDEVQLALFRQGIGLLTIRIAALSQDVSDWLDLIHHSRFIRRARGHLQIRRRVGRDSATLADQWRPYFPAVAGGLTTNTDGCGTLGDLIRGLLRSTVRNSSASDWWREVFVPGQMIPFACLFLDQVPSGDQESILHTVHNFFGAEQGRLAVPTTSGADAMRWEYTSGQTFLFSPEGTGFVAFDPPDTPFFRQTLPSNLWRQYFPLFQITLFQRFALMEMSERISRGWYPDQPSREPRAAEVLASIRDRLLRFTAAGYFTQVSQRPRQHTCYKSWQKCFQIHELYERTRQALDDMQAYLTQQREERMRFEFQRLDLRLRQIALILGPPALALSFLGISGIRSIYLAAGALVGGLILGWVCWLVLLWSTDPSVLNRKKSSGNLR
jgi:hypothetical protein